MLPGMSDEVSGSFGWSIEQRLEIVAGVLSLTGGLLLPCRTAPRCATHLSSIRAPSESGSEEGN